MTIKPSFLKGGLIGLAFIIFNLFWWLFIDFFGLWLVLFCQLSFVFIGSIILIVSTKTRLSIDDGLVTYKMNKEIKFHMDDIESIEYHLFTKRIKHKFVTMFEVYFFDKNQNKLLQISYFAFESPSTKVEGFLRYTVLRTVDK